MSLTYFLRHYALVSIELILILALVGRIYGDAASGGDMGYDLLTGFVLPAYAVFYVVMATANVLLCLINFQTEEVAMRLAIARAKSGKTEPIAIRHSLAFNILTHIDTIVLVAACWKAGLPFVAGGLGISFLIGKPAEHFNILRLRRAEEAVAAIRSGLSMTEETTSANAPEITRIGNCFIVHGPFRIEILSDLQSVAKKDDVMDMHVARLMGATIAIGPAEELDALSRDPAVLEASRARSAAELSGVTLPAGALEWHATGHRGASSDAIFHFLLGLPVPDGIRVPLDASDFRRCRLLLEQVPDFARNLDKMAAASPVWARLAGRWNELCAVMDEECPDWRTGSAPCPATSELLRSIVD